MMWGGEGKKTDVCISGVNSSSPGVFRKVQRLKNDFSHFSKGAGYHNQILETSARGDSNMTLGWRVEVEVWVGVSGFPVKFNV
jgi:hypothetical protein